MKRYDLVVVGSGPAGLMAAKVAGENGLKVALVERKKFIPKVMRPCAEGLFAHRWSHGEYVKVNYRDSRFCFPANGFSVKYEGPLKDLHHFINYSPDGHQMQVRFYLEDAPGRIFSQHISFDKESLLNGLLEEAIENHVDVYPGVNVTRAEKVEEGMTVSGNGYDLWGVFVIGADGVHSRLARVLGLNKERMFYGTLFARTWRMKGLEPAHKDAHIHIAGGKGVPPLFCICPRAREDEYLITVGGYHPDSDFEKRLHEIMKQGTFSKWFKKAEMGSRQALILNLLSPIKEPFSQNCLLIGDACAFAQISNHHALLCGWKAAHAITLALIDHKYNKDGISGYLDWWKKIFFETHHTPRADVFESMEGEEINYLFSLFKEPIPAARDDKEAEKNMNEAMARIMPAVKKDRPDLYGRLSGFMSKPPDETWEEHRKAGFPPK
jgi:flavin-dependent dehydrogenase